MAYQPPIVEVVEQVAASPANLYLALMTAQDSNNTLSLEIARTARK